MTQRQQEHPQFKGIVEFPKSFAPRPENSQVPFYFDGTRSLIREGWPEVMATVLLEIIPGP